MQWVDDGSTRDASIRLTSIVRGTTLTRWEMKPPMQVGCRSYRWADFRAFG
jgi:hypothetical protein